MLKGEVFCKVFKMHGQHVLEYSPVPSAQFSTAACSTSSTSPRQPVAASTDIWHCRLGHIHEEALTKLLAAADCQETTQLVRRRAVESRVIVYVPTVERLGQVTYQRRDGPGCLRNIPRTRLALCSQGGLVYAASTNWASIGA
jgi:hypothetical protein